MTRNKGFTLIEVLIVVVIIAILAALVVPRFMSQPEKAVIAEANQMLGAISRAQNICVDSGACTSGWVELDEAGLALIGMRAPSSLNFTYTCTAPTAAVEDDPAGAGICTATRAGAETGTHFGDTITIDDTGVWDCGDYTPLDAGGCSA